MNRYVYCVTNPLRFVDPTGTRGVGTDYYRTHWELHKQYPMTWDEFMAALGYIPGVDIVSDLYFPGKAIYYEDWETAAFYGGCALVPLVGGSWIKSGAKATGKTFGVKWLDFGRYNTPSLWHLRKGSENEGSTPLPNHF